MNKRIQVILSEQALVKLEKTHEEAKKGFQTGTISLADVLNEMILESNLDLKELRTKHTNLKKSLLKLAKEKDLDVETALKVIQDLKSKLTKKNLKSVQKQETKDL